MDVFLQSIEHISLMIKTDHNTTQQLIHFVFFNVLIHLICVYPASDIHEYPFRLRYVFSNYFAYFSWKLVNNAGDNKNSEKVLTVLIVLQETSRKHSKQMHFWFQFQQIPILIE